MSAVCRFVAETLEEAGVAEESTGEMAQVSGFEGVHVAVDAFKFCVEFVVPEGDVSDDLRFQVAGGRIKEDLSRALNGCLMVAEELRRGGIDIGCYVGTGVVEDIDELSSVALFDAVELVVAAFEAGSGKCLMGGKVIGDMVEGSRSEGFGVGVLEEGLGGGKGQEKEGSDAGVGFDIVSSGERRIVVRAFGKHGDGMLTCAGILHGEIWSRGVEDDEGDVIDACPLPSRKFECFSGCGDVGDGLVGFGAVSPFAFDDDAIAHEVVAVPIAP